MVPIPLFTYRITPTTTVRNIIDSIKATTSTTSLHNNNDIKSAEVKKIIICQEPRIPYYNKKDVECWYCTIILYPLLPLRIVSRTM